MNKISLAIILTLLISLPSVAMAQKKWILVDGGTWEPDDKLISNIQNQIKNYINTETNYQGKKIKNLENYTFQYQGREENGNHYVFINAFCEYQNEINLEKHMLIVFDGGNCYLTIKYNKIKNIFYQLYVNGEA